MGVVSKAVVLLLIAVTTPLIYRQFADDNTVKFMSSYYSNYKSIDKFLRQSAHQFDRASDGVVPTREQLNDIATQIKSHVDSILESAKTKLTNMDGGQNRELKASKVTPPKSKRICQCPTENYAGKEIRLWTKDELSKYDGKSGESRIYLGFLGLVYDVSNNAHHYSPGADYNVFAGRDASRAFLTGNFTHDLTDDLTGVEKNLYPQIETWSNFYQTNYPVLGRIEGRFFDSEGCATQSLAEVKLVLDALQKEKKLTDQREKSLPECNSEWNGDLKKGRVWCSTKSGGIERDWIGVPRIYSAGESQRCVCLNLGVQEDGNLSKSLSVYPGCDPRASECSLSQ